jgi:hypothetical protein
MAANMADTSPDLETARPRSDFQSGNTTKQAATELADLAVTKFIGFSGLPAQSRRYGCANIFRLGRGLAVLPPDSAKRS